MEKVENLKETGTKNEVLIDKEESAIDKKATEKKSKSKAGETYTGWYKWIPTSDEWLDFEADGKLPDYMHILENEYLLVYDESEPDKLSRQYVMKKGKLERIGRSSITIKQCGYGSKNIHKTYLPKNDEQVCAFDLIKDRTSTVKLLAGKFGTGKSMLLVSGALELLEHEQFDKIIWIRNNIDVKDTKDLGALPGEVFEKLKPFLGPFIDHAGETRVMSMVQDGRLVVEPLQYLRGRNFENSLILCSEAENLTKEHIQLIIARAAEGSEVWFDGDCRQRDKVSFEKSQGVEKMIEKFKGNPLFGYVYLPKTERSATAAMADLLD